MKKQILVFCILVTMILSSVPVYAQSGSYTAADRITLVANQTESTFEITFDHPSAYAGAEIQVLCAEGVEITSVTYNTNVGNAGPTTSKGFVWFSFFTGDNQITDKVTATITISYSGNANTSLLIRNISMYTKEGARVDTELLNADKTVEIRKEGADNPVVPPELPEEETSAGSDSGNSNSGDTDSGNNDLDNTTQKNASQGNMNQSNTNQGNTNQSNADKENNSKENSSSSLESTKSSEGNNSNGSTDSKQVESDNLKNSSTPAQGINIVIMIAAVISICTNIVLVFLYRKKGKKEN